MKVIIAALAVAFTIAASLALQHGMQVMQVALESRLAGNF